MRSEEVRKKYRDWQRSWRGTLIKSQVWAVRHKDNSNGSDKMVHFAYFDTEKEAYDYLVENDVNTESPHVEVNVYQTTLA